MSDEVKIPKELADRIVRSGLGQEEMNQLVAAIKPQLKTVEERRAERLRLPWKKKGSDGRVSDANDALMEGPRTTWDQSDLIAHAPALAEALHNFVDPDKLLNRDDAWELLTRARWYSPED